MQRNVLDIVGPFMLHVMNKGKSSATAKKLRRNRRPVRAPQLLTWVSWPAPQGIIVYRGVYFGLYDTAKGVLFDDERRASFFAKWAVAQTVTALAGIASYPFDTVRRRLMMQARRMRLLAMFMACWRQVLLMH